MTREGLVLEDLGKNNIIDIDGNTKFQASRVTLNGDGNKVVIGDCLLFQNLTVNFKGNNKTIIIGASTKAIRGLKLVSIRGNGQQFLFGENFSCGGMEIQMNDGDEKIEIGDNCLFSWGIKARTSDGHSIIDVKTGKAVNFPKNISIGDRVWVGEDVRFLKGASVQNDSVVGSAAVVTKAFSQQNAVIAGFPARIVKENITWDYKPPNQLSSTLDVNEIKWEQDTILKEQLFSCDYKQVITEQKSNVSDEVKGAVGFSGAYIEPAIQVYKLKNVEILGDEFFVSAGGVYAKDRRLLYLTSQDAVEKKTLSNSVVKDSSGKVFVLCANAGYKNFYHWMYQSLPVILQAQATLVQNDFKIVVPPLSSFQKRCIDILGIGKEQIFELEDDKRFLCETLIYSNLLSGEFSFKPSNYMLSLFAKFRDKCISRLKNDSAPKKVFISRKDTPRRSLENEAEVTKLLSEMGYTEIIMSELTLEEQVLIMFRAEYIVAPHGAALVHLVFTSHCKGLLEILPSNYYNDCFFRICQIKQIPYINMTSEAVGSGHYHYTSSNLDIEKLKLLVNELESENKKGTIK